MTAIPAKERCPNLSLCPGLQGNRGRQGSGVKLKAEREHRSGKRVPKMNIPLGSSLDSCVGRNNGELGAGEGEPGAGEGELGGVESELETGELGAALTCVMVVWERGVTTGLCILI